MDTEFNINTQKGKINCWELFRLRIHCKPFLGTGKIINTQLRRLPFQERKKIRQTNEKQWPAYNGVKKVFTPLLAGSLQNLQSTCL